MLGFLLATVDGGWCFVRGTRVSRVVALAARVGSSRTRAVTRGLRSLVSVLFEDLDAVRFASFLCQLLGGLSFLLQREKRDVRRREDPDGRTETQRVRTKKERERV